jgi:hypothetical protein
MFTFAITNIYKRVRTNLFCQQQVITGGYGNTPYRLNVTPTLCQQFCFFVNSIPLVLP